MATYRVTDPATGRTVKLTGDSPPSEQELTQVFSSLGPATQTPTQPAGPSMGRRGWEALRLPEQMATQVLTPDKPMTSLAPEVSPSMLKTLATGTPRVMEETGRDIGNFLKRISPPVPQDPMTATAERAVAEFVPGLVSRGSLLAMGALKGIQIAKPAIKATGVGIAKGAEALSGLEHKTPGVLVDAANDSSLILSKGKQAAKALYETGKKVGGEVGSALSKISGKKEFVEKAAELAEESKLLPTEALEARKELDGIKKTVTGEFYRKTRDKLDKIAKLAFTEGDAAYQRAVKSEALRSFLPLNKTGGASTFKTTVGAALGGPPILAMSPIVQGATATGIGMAARAAAPLVNNPAIAGPALGAIAKVLTDAKAKEFVKKAKNDPELARKLAHREGYTWEGKENWTPR